MNWKEKLPYVSEAIKKLNPHLFVGGLANPQREPNPVQTLARRPPVQKRSKGGVAPRITVYIISFRSRFLDSDNLAAGAKPLRDAIAKSLGLDDSDDLIRWRYEQIKSDSQGTSVTIERESQK